MPGPRKSDAGGEVTSSSVGANVKILWREEELERVHFPLLQVPWSFVGRLRDEAEKNEHMGMMTVDLAILRNDGAPLFTDDFPQTFREVFVRRFVPCLNEKFNQRDSKPLSKLPEDVGDGVRLLVLCERLKAALKQDVKDHLDRQLARSERTSTRPAESAPFKIVQASLELDGTVPPRGTLQERVVQHAMEILTSQLPESLDALQELLMLACDLGRNEMCTRIFRATTEKALTMAGKTLPAKKAPASKIEEVKEEDSAMSEDQLNTSRESKKIESERQRLMLMMKEMEQQRRDMRDEMHRLEQLRANVAGQGYSVAPKRTATELVDPMDNNSMSEENSLSNGQSSNETNKATYLAQHGALALRQGIVLEKVGRNTGERIVRMVGDTLEWRKGSGRFTKEHTVLRQDVVSIKVVDPLGKTFLLSTKTGLLTLRALNEQAASMLVQAIDAWAKNQQGNKLKRAPITPSMAVPHTVHTMAPMIQAQPSMINGGGAATSRRFPRISMSFKRPGTSRGDQLAVHRGADYSFTSHGEGSFLDNDD